MMDIEKLKEVLKLFNDFRNSCYMNRSLHEAQEIIDELIKEAQPFDPYSLKVDDLVYVWDGERPENPEKSYFAVYTPKSGYPFRCFAGYKKQEEASMTPCWEHCEPVEEEK